MTAPQDTATMAKGGHTPVMLREVIEALSPRDGAIYVDGTFGAGGYAEAILAAADCRVWGIDRDPEAVARGQTLAARHPERLKLIHGCFGAMDSLLGAHQVFAVDGIALDLGVSSMQLDQAERGFSFRAEGPLDMRMGRGAAGDATGDAVGDAAGNDEDTGPSAAEVVNELSEAELADIIHHYGEERRARQVARAIVAARRERPIEDTARLAEIVRAAVRAASKGRGTGKGRAGKGGAGRGIDPATRTFQALRIHVNDELGELDRGLHAAERLLAPGGRLAVVSFHSLEDRAVKVFLRARSGAGPGGSRHRPETTARRDPTFLPLFRGACRPSRVECDGNPRARSARLRAAERTAASAWGDMPAISAANPGGGSA
ncbi:MAG: 16S rRNA (cytosine(1402)-N(4))-methyltransferase [Alphaproteobacteria bacterium]